MEEMNALGRRSIWVALCAFMLVSSPCLGQPGTWESSTDRPGMDYRIIDYDQWYVDSCRAECKADPKCMAYTSCLDSAKQTSRCYLKSGVPPSVRSELCVSGIIKPVVEGLGRSAASSLLALKASSCARLEGFVTPSPLPTTGVGWDYTVQLQATGGVRPVSFLTPYLDPQTGVQRALSCSSSGSTSGPLYYPGKMMVDGLTLTCDGRITGQPKAPGYYAVRVVVQDSCVIPQQVEKKFVLEVKGPS